MHSGGEEAEEAREFTAEQAEKERALKRELAGPKAGEDVKIRGKIMTALRPEIEKLEKEAAGKPVTLGKITNLHESADDYCDAQGASDAIRKEIHEFIDTRMEAEVAPPGGETPKERLKRLRDLAKKHPDLTPRVSKGAERALRREGKAAQKAPIAKYERRKKYIYDPIENLSRILAESVVGTFSPETARHWTWARQGLIAPEVQSMEAEMADLLEPFYREIKEKEARKYPKVPTAVAPEISGESFLQGLLEKLGF